MVPYGFYSTLCVLMGPLWVLIGPYSSLCVLMVSCRSLCVLIGPDSS